MTTVRTEPTTGQLARAERADLAAFLETLAPEQWDAPTLCARWRVRDLVAHVISYDELGVGGLIARLARARFLPGRANDIGVAEYRTRRPAELISILSAHVTPRGLPAAGGGAIALTDGLIHHQDIRRPLGMPRHIPPDRLRRTLEVAMTAPPIGAFWRARGLRLVATDLDWTAGRGPEVRGPAESILMTVAGRPGVVGELSGPGQPTLAGRLSA